MYGVQRPFSLITNKVDLNHLVFSSLSFSLFQACVLLDDFRWIDNEESLASAELRYLNNYKERKTYSMRAFLSVLIDVSVEQQRGIPPAVSILFCYVGQKGPESSHTAFGSLRLPHAS